MKKYWISSLLSSSIITTPFFISSACSSSKIDEDYDQDISIKVSWINPGFEKHQKEFEEMFSKRFNELKNSNEKLKNQPDAKISFSTFGDQALAFDDLRVNKKDTDIAFLQYFYLSNFYKDANDIEKNKVRIIGQSETLKFAWDDFDDNIINNQFNLNELYKVGQNENLIQFSNIYNEFPNWKEINNEPYYFDGSKYSAFYQNDKTTPFYRGAIIIAGDKNQREQITNAWLNKDYETFLKFGLIYQDINSGGQFIYQSVLIAKQFNKKLEEVIFDLTSDKSKYRNNVLKVNSVPAFIGKRVENNYFNIGFVNEGEFNWTQKALGEDLFKPEGFDKSGDEQRVVRVLSLTTPAVYESVVARSGLNKDQAELLIKTFESLDINENKIGIFTGYNKIKPISNTEFNKYLKIQKATMGWIDNWEE